MMGIVTLVFMGHAPGGYYYPQGSRMGELLDVGDVWTMKYNDLFYGYSESSEISYQWPGGQNAYYLYKGGLWIGAQVGDDKFASTAFYDEEAFESCGDAATSPTGFLYVGPGKSVKDLLAEDCEKGTIPNPLGVHIYERTMTWPTEPYNQFFGHEYMIIFDNATQTYDRVFISVWFDADVCSANGGQFWYNDMVAYDGLYNDAYYEDPYYATMTYKLGREDTLTVLADTTLPGPDGVPDGYFVWGDDLEERIISYAAGYDTTDLPTLPDGRKYMYIIPNNTSYIYTNPDIAEEVAACPGYIFATLVYADPTSTDSTFADEYGGGRIPRVYSHQWWNIETDPQDDESIFDYMAGQSPGTNYLRFAPIPLDFGAPYFDYRFLLTIGPYENVAPGDTIRFAIVTGVGMGLNGGVDNYWRGGAYLRGVRQLVQYAYRAYYLGSTDSDPGHPDAPDVLNVRDDHWKIPIPPPSPSLSYTAVGSNVNLVWDNLSEITPDLITGEIDFAGYVVVRSTFKPAFQKPYVEADGSVNPGSVLAVIFKEGYDDSTKAAILADIFNIYDPGIIDSLRNHGVVVIDGIVRNFVDSTAVIGFPYFYAVAAFDKPAEGKSLLGAFNNYRRTTDGQPDPVYITTPPAADWMNKVRVVPNPFNGSTKWSADKLTQEVEFQNLPPSARIDIYTLAGDHVRTIIHNDPASGSERWNLLNKHGTIVAPGIYLIKITDDKGNYKILKFMVLR